MARQSTDVGMKPSSDGVDMEKAEREREGRGSELLLGQWYSVYHLLWSRQTYFHLLCVSFFSLIHIY